MTADVEIKKADKRDIVELRQIISNGLDSKPDLQEIQSSLNKFTNDQTQKAYDLR